MATFDLTARYAQSATVRPGKRWVVHHSGRDELGTTMGAEIAHLDALNRYHRDDRGWRVGIGYHVVVFPSGRSYRVGTQGTTRAHVAGLNDKFDGLCFVGNFENDERPSDAALAEAARVIKDSCMAVAGGHREFVTTTCPGNWDLALLDGLSAPLTVADLGTLWRAFAPGLPRMLRPNGVTQTPKARRNGHRVIEVELP